MTYTNDLGHREWFLRRSLENRSSQQIIEELEKVDNQGELSEMAFTRDGDNNLQEKLDTWKSLEEKGYWYLTILDKDYPSLLKEIPNPPAILFGIGARSVLSEFSIAIVGSRNASDYGLYAAEKISRELTLDGVAVVSGLAIGIDSTAHEACLEYGGKTIAVLACGIDTIYPRRNIGLARKIIGSGCIITEYPPGSPPLGYHFHERNRILSGLAHGVIVVEANRKSGTMITTRHAGDQGREVFAIPGNINQPRSQGTNELIQLGAKLVMDVSDVASEFASWPKRVRQSLIKLANANESAIYKQVESEPKTFQELLDITKMSINDLWATITSLEMQGLLIENNHGKYEWLKE